METKRVVASGAQLFTNTRCQLGGYVEVEAMDPWDDAWPSFSRENCQTFSGDSVRHQVSWEDSSITALKGVLKFRFHLRHAELYGFQIAKPDVRPAQANPLE